MFGTRLLLAWVRSHDLLDLFAKLPEPEERDDGTLGLSSISPPVTQQCVLLPGTGASALYWC